MPAKNKHVKVFALNILSFIKTYVITANTKFDTPKAKSFDGQSSFVTETMFLVPYQKQRPTKGEKTRFVKSGLSSHQLQTN